MTPNAAALQGTVHLSKMPRITLTCKALDLDYAVAMVGFEVRGGMSVPCFDGVIVCEEHAEAIKEAYYAAEGYDTLLFLLSSDGELLGVSQQDWPLMPDFMSCTKAAAKALHRGVPTALLFLGMRAVRWSG